mmetsp:Transcript_5106/g.7532  ORF Transcript_5106/g.7532 Transcript_5106/m.7532 type:complete len:647 (-) Transcript_5106:333-2273(-)|eukprot:CAMPEP_0203663974 /NCGR_PEP_ID=MMETSP0090-20130426/1481_1 /ASSEMBLY_ACC=CAM_ASM_001088 /TAXON_ID=426623 /ORGANISM="Chaetoceros affinis, Strain CCMP159" /LENGTH=646 /DNA_ID=CAMNT_0050527053 /DNA_START=65 /DNA_END=2005 /DNA_ORIENTATION=+
MSTWYVHPIPLNSKRDRHSVCAVDNYRAVIIGGTNGSEPLNTMELVDIRQMRNDQDVMSSTEFDAINSGSNISINSSHSSNCSISSIDNNNNFISPRINPARTSISRNSTSTSITRNSTSTSQGRTRLPNLPGSRTLTGHESVIHGDFLYVMGGYRDDNDFIPLKSVYRINIGNIINEENNTRKSRPVWEIVGQMNEARQDFSSACHGDYIYVFGGYNNHTKTYLSCAERYNTISGEWQNIPSMKTQARASHASITIGDKIYVLGGRIGTNALRTTEVFDTVKQRWEIGAPMLCPLHSMAAVSIGDWIVTIGGRSDDPCKALGQSFVWNTAQVEGDCDSDGSGTWHQTQQNLTLPRKDHAAVVLDDTEIVALGGSSGNGGFTFDSIESIAFHDMLVDEPMSSNCHDSIRRNETSNDPIENSRGHENPSVSSGYGDTWYPAKSASTTPSDGSLSTLSQTTPTSSPHPSTLLTATTAAIPPTAPISQPPTQHQFDVFISYNYGEDDMGRDNPTRVKKIKEELNARGITTWFDSEHLSRNIVDEMTAGIDNAMAVIVFITNAYITKAAGEGPNGSEDNCKLEFSYARRRKTSKNMIPVVMEKSCYDSANWKGTVGATLGDHLQIRFTSDDQLKRCVDSIIEKIELIRQS